MDREEFEARLKDLPREHVVLIAARAAMRVFPVVSHISRESQQREPLALLTARAILTSGVAVKMPTPDAADAAADASRDAADAAAYAARAAARAADAAAYKDVSLVVDTLWSTPIWHEPGEPDWLVDALSDRDDILNAGPEWAFWRKWYQGFLNGTHLDWELQRRVALIEEEIWEAGPAAVAEEIARIEGEFRTAISVPLVRNEADTAFVLDDEQPLDDELLDYIKERVGGALRTALDGSSANVFNESSPEALAISEALLSKNPSAVAGHLNDASLFFQKNFGDLYPEDEGVLIALQEATFSGAEEICETNELARKRCLKASRLFQRDHPKPMDAEEMKEFTSKIANEAEGEAKAIIQRIGQAIADGKKVGRFARARFANYSSTIVSWIDKIKKGEARVSWLWKKVRELMMCSNLHRKGDGGVNPTLPFDLRAARLAGRGVAILRFDKQRFIALYR